MPTHSEIFERQTFLSLWTTLSIDALWILRTAEAGVGKDTAYTLDVVFHELKMALLEAKTLLNNQ